MKTNAAIRAGLRRFCMQAKPKGSLKAAVFNEVKTEKPLPSLPLSHDAISLRQSATDRQPEKTARSFRLPEKNGRRRKVLRRPFG